MANTVTIAINIGFNSQVGYDSYTGFDDQYDHNNHMGLDYQSCNNSYKYWFQWPR